MDPHLAALPAPTGADDIATPLPAQPGLEKQHLEQELVRINEERTLLARMRELDEEEVTVRARLQQLGA
jgi:hypothetical protein